MLKEKTKWVKPNLTQDIFTENNTFPLKFSYKYYACIYFKICIYLWKNKIKITIFNNE